MNAPLKWALRLAAIPAAVAAYVAIAGLTGVCPSCKGIVDGVLGRHEAMSRPARAVASVAGLTAYTLDGEPVDLASYAGKPLILDFWATWCGPCRRQRDIMHALEAELHDSAVVLSLSVDSDPRLVQKFIAKNPAGTLELMAPAELQAAVGGISAVPTLVFVDATGAIRGVGAGVHSAHLLRARLAELASPAP